MTNQPKSDVKTAEEIVEHFALVNGGEEQVLISNVAIDEALAELTKTIESKKVSEPKNFDDDGVVWNAAIDAVLEALGLKGTP